MEIDAVTTLISSLGFPIVCTIALFWLLKNEQDKHKAEADNWVESFNRNNNTLEKMIELLDANKNSVEANTDIIKKLIDKS